MPNTRGPLPDPSARRRKGELYVFRAEIQPLDDAAPPEHLDNIGRTVWQEATACSWVQQSDALAVTRLAELESERARAATALEDAGPLLKKPVVSPRGDVVGEESFANPMFRELRRLDAAISELRKALGLDPMSRARLGVRVLEAKTALSRLERVPEKNLPDPRLAHPLEAL
jgi:P27 family predicted phage terminase small subunit